MVLFKTNIVQDSFSYILNNALFFTENNEETIKSTVIKGKTFNSQQKYDSFSGKFIIIGCTFSKCEIINVENKDNGGALYIEQDCLLTIHGTTFTECKVSFNGGAAYICKRRVTFNYVDDYYTQIEDEKLPEANIQYCCFDRCQSGYENNDGDASKGFGPNAIIAGTKVNLLYTSSSNHLREKPDRSRARSGVFDIQSIDVSILHINVTEGYSKVTGALDIRGAQSGKIQFQTFDQVDCMYLESFIGTSGLEISDANMIRNKMKKYIGNNIPAFIRARDSSVVISRYSANHNEIKDGFKIAMKNDQVSSSSIMLVDWYLYGFDTHDEGGDFQSDNVIYYNNNVQVELTSISHLALNECGGNVTVAPLIITPIFTNSEYFSYSQFFSKSSQFSNSEPFSKTLDFSNSGEFTNTGEFSKTSSFSETTKFSESFKFSKSADFSNSKQFSSSGFFTETVGFTTSSLFSRSGIFSETSYFSESKDFTKSLDFSNSKQFSSSGFFTETAGFTTSSLFSRSGIFSETSDFSESKDFTKSFDFTKSNVFPPTEYFGHTHSFSPSSTFSYSSDFTKSTYFSESNFFSRTNGFTKTTEFSQTQDFSKTECFSKSVFFSISNNFSNSLPFSKSTYFSYSNYFTRTKDFSCSTAFTKSLYFSKSDALDLTELTCTQLFSQSLVFSLSFIFSQTKTFFIKTNVILISINSEKSQKISTGIMIGIGLTCAAVVAAAILVSVFLLRRKKLVPVEEFEDETIDIFDENANSIITQNPLNNLMSDDDPFEDEFI